MNTKQSKQATSPAVNKPVPARQGSSQPRPDNPSQFQWPVTSQATSFAAPTGITMGGGTMGGATMGGGTMGGASMGGTAMGGTSVGQASHQVTQSSSSYSQQSVSSMLPPINALTQSTRLPTQQLPSSSGYPLTSHASLSNYSASGGGATNPLVNYPYSQFPMFGMTGGLPDMATLNPSTLTGLAMQYYRQDSSGHGANNTSGI